MDILLTQLEELSTLLEDEAYYDEWTGLDEDGELDDFATKIVPYDEVRSAVDKLIAACKGHVTHVKVRQSDSDYTDEPHYLCEECGGHIPFIRLDDDGRVVEASNYCPNCGRKVLV